MLEEMVLGSNKFVSRNMVSLLGIALCLNLRPPAFKEGDRVYFKQELLKIEG